MQLWRRRPQSLIELWTHFSKDEANEDNAFQDKLEELDPREPSVEERAEIVDGEYVVSITSKKLLH